MAKKWGVVVFLIVKDKLPKKHVFSENTSFPITFNDKYQQKI
jgi:hypothetical protein